MKRILCPVDFSEAAQNAAEYAARIAKKMKAGITLIHVRVLADLTIEEATYKKDLNQQAVRVQLEELSEQITNSFNVPCGFLMEETAFSLSKIINSDALDYDLIIMGTHGTSSIGQFLFGTHTYKVIRESKVPVLLVPAGCTYHEIKLMVFAYDYWRTDQLPLSSLLTFARILKSRLLILEVMEESVSQKIEKELREDQIQIKKFYADEGLDIQFDTIHSAELASSINSYMLRSQADLLTLSNARHSMIEKIFHKSVIKDISGIATYPVFVF